MVVQIIFLIIAAVTLLTAIMVVSVKSMVHAALWLVASLFGVAILYILLDAGFFAMAQVLIYIGAIAILFIFAVMLTRRIMQENGPQSNANWWLAAVVVVVLFAGLVFMLSQSGIFTRLPVELASEKTNLTDLGLLLVSAEGYLLPFELASVLLVAAMVGAIYASWARK